jgi:large subunit ribosomal protein L29
MKNTEIKGLTVAELKEKIGSETENLRKIKFAHQISSIENPMRIKETRKLIARLHTDLTAEESKK